MLCGYTNYICLVLSIPLKNMSQLGWLFPIYGGKMFQTTNQIWYHIIAIRHSANASTPALAADQSSASPGCPRRSSKKFVHEATKQRNHETYLNGLRLAGLNGAWVNLGPSWNVKFNLDSRIVKNIRSWKYGHTGHTTTRSLWLMKIAMENGPFVDDSWLSNHQRLTASL